MHQPTVLLARALVLGAAMLCSPAWSQAVKFPVKPVTLIQPYTPGGSTDIEARLYHQRLTEALGQTVLLDYKPGAGSAVGTAWVAKQPPDGYTIISVTPALTIIPAFYPDKPPYDAANDLSPITQMTKRSAFLLVPPSLGIKNFEEYMAYVKANPGKLNFGTSGPGSIFHISGAWLHAMTNTKVVFVHYKGAAPMHADLMAGTIQAGPAPVFVGLPYVKSGTLLPVAFMGSKRYKGTPELKTVAEQGWPDFEYASWSGFLAPAKTPPAIIEAWHAAFSKVAKAPEVVAKMDADGAEMIANRPEEFRKIIVTELARYRKIVQENDIKAEQ
jgi:tripartite-type tricarboxylate transporter receptor subunit TctC